MAAGWQGQEAHRWLVVEGETMEARGKENEFLRKKNNAHASTINFLNPKKAYGPGSIFN